MLRVTAVLSAVLLAGCASTVSNELHEERYRFSVKSVKSSSHVVTDLLPQDVEYGDQLVQIGISSYQAELNKTLGIALLGVATDYGSDSMDVTLNFDYCEGGVVNTPVYSCANVAGNYQETLSYEYNSLPKEVVLGNGLRFEVSLVEM